MKNLRTVDVALEFPFASTGDVAGLAAFEQVSGRSGATTFPTDVRVAVVD